MSLRVVAYNILDGGEDRLDVILAILQGFKPDAVALLEANDRINAKWLAEELGMYFTFGEANNPYHIAWLSKQEPIASHNHRHHALEKTLLEIEVEWRGQPLCLFAAHLAPHAPAAERRLEETRTILELVGARRDTASLLVGDFNDAPTSTVVDLIGKAGFVDCYRAVHGDDDHDTRPVEDTDRRIDYIFASAPLAEGLGTCSMRRGSDAVAASDHYAICAEFGPE